MMTGKEDLLQALVEAFIMEKGTKEFYRQAAAKSGTASARKAFEELEAWEAKHMAYVQSLYQSIVDDRELQEFSAFSGSVSAPVTEGGIPVKDLEKRIEKHSIAGEKEALQLAMTIEAKAHRVYKDLAAMARDSETKVIFEEMMAQEMKHIDHLNALKKGLSA